MIYFRYMSLYVQSEGVVEARSEGFGQIQERRCSRRERGQMLVDLISFTCAYFLQYVHAGSKVELKIGEAGLCASWNAARVHVR
jgi:hypothetical protein